MKAKYRNHMGTDLSVVNAARVSFGKESRWAEKPTWTGVKFGVDEYEGDYVLSKADKGLIQFLARGCTSGDWNNLADELCEFEMFPGNEDMPIHPEFESLMNHIRRMPPHWTPFAHTAITIHLKMPIFVARQIMKHTTGFAYNEVSRRYVDDDPEFYVPDVWRKRADNVKQGSSDEEVNVYGRIGVNPVDWCCEALEQYKQLIKSGVAPEQARMVLPQSMYTEVIATANLYGWANLYVQRTDSHAQKETRVLAKQIGEICQPLFPESWKALTQ